MTHIRKMTDPKPADKLVKMERSGLTTALSAGLGPIDTIISDLLHPYIFTAWHMYIPEPASPVTLNLLNQVLIKGSVVVVILVRVSSVRSFLYHLISGVGKL